MKFVFSNLFQHPTTPKRNVSAADLKGSLGIYAGVLGADFWGYEHFDECDNSSARFHTIAKSGDQ
jgi:hypothetical protein